MAIKYRNIIKSGEEIRSEVKRSMSPDPVSSTDRWDDDNARWSLNQALQFVGNKLRFPLVYTLDTDSDHKDFLLPNYVEGPLDPQKRVYSRLAMEGEGDAGSAYWQDTVSHNLTVRSDGKTYLELPFYAGGDDVRIIYWPTNPPYPLEEVKLAVDLEVDDDGMVLDIVLDSLGQNGYVNIAGEVILYQGLEQGTTTTLLPTARSVNGMPQVPHVAGTTVDFCISAHDQSVFQILQWWAMAMMHGQYLNRASEQERNMHDMQQRLYIQLAKEHLRDSYQPARSPRMRMDRVATGIAGMDRWTRRHGH